MPHCCIGADVIVGFPGETEEEFLKTYHFLNELDISYLHVFSYSERANTAAVELENSVPKAIRNKRSKCYEFSLQKNAGIFTNNK